MSLGVGDALAATGNRSSASSLCQVEAGLGRILSPDSGASGVYRSRVEPTEAVPIIARNEGVPGSGPGVGFAQPGAFRLAESGTEGGGDNQVATR
jgi:hypothetical protein